MKSIFLVGAVTGCVMAGCAFGALLQDWRFDDHAGVALDGASNSVSGGVSFSLAHSGAAVDGGGFYVLNGGTQQETSVANLSNVSSGALYMRVDLSGWDLSGPGTSEQQIFRLEGLNNVRFVVSRNSSQVLLQGWSAGGGGNLGTVMAKPSSYQNAISAILEVDMDHSQYRLHVGTDESWDVSTWAALPSIFQINQLAFLKSGDFTDSGGSGDVLNIDRIRIGDQISDVIPEPATVSLMALAGGIIWVCRTVAMRPVEIDRA